MHESARCIAAPRDAATKDLYDDSSQLELISDWLISWIL